MPLRICNRELPGCREMGKGLGIEGQDIESGESLAAHFKWANRCAIE